MCVCVSRCPWLREKPRCASGRSTLRGLGLCIWSRFVCLGAGEDAWSAEVRTTKIKRKFEKSDADFRNKKENCKKSDRCWTKVCNCSRGADLKLNVETVRVAWTRVTDAPHPQFQCWLDLVFAVADFCPRNARTKGRRKGLSTLKFGARGKRDERILRTWCSKQLQTFVGHQ